MSALQPSQSLPPLALPLAPADTTTLAEPGGTVIVQTRRIRAPRGRVWAAWIDPGHLGQWWGPAGFSLTTEAFEFRPEGKWIFVMHGPDPDPAAENPGAPRDFPNHIVWTRIEAGSPPDAPSVPWVIEFRHLRADDLQQPLFHASVTLEECEDGTLLTWRSDFGSNALREQLIRDYGADRGGRETTARLAHYTEGDDFAATDRALGYRLVLSRILTVRREPLWRAWTEPELVQQWFCPPPWRVDRCDIDLRAGGRFNTHMVGPDNWQGDNDGSYLEVVPLQRLTFTDLLLENWSPAPSPGLRLTATILFEDLGDGRTRYTAIVRHSDVASRRQHARMGFHEGWGIATEQLLQLAATLPT